MSGFTEASEIAQSVKCLLCKHKDLSSTLCTHTKSLGMMADTCNPSTGEVETGGSLRTH